MAHTGKKKCLCDKNESSTRATTNLVFGLKQDVIKCRSFVCLQKTKKRKKTPTNFWPLTVQTMQSMPAVLQLFVQNECIIVNLFPKKITYY